MAFNHDQNQSQKWWKSLNDTQQDEVLDKTTIFNRERNLSLSPLREKEILFLWRRYSGEFKNI